MCGCVWGGWKWKCVRGNGWKREKREKKERLCEKKERRPQTICGGRNEGRFVREHKERESQKKKKGFFLSSHSQSSFSGTTAECCSRPSPTSSWLCFVYILDTRPQHQLHKRKSQVNTWQTQHLAHSIVCVMPHILTDEYPCNAMPR